MNTPWLQTGQVLAGTYTIVRRIGHGGMGEIYEATHARLRGRYAIKLMRNAGAALPEVWTRFEREAAVTSALRHPCIVQVLDFCATDDGAPFLVMEFLDGRDLADELAAHGPMPLARVSALIGHIASALATAHQAGVIHRDLKPQNIKLVTLAGTEDPLPKLVDFGISKMRFATTALTRSDTVMGTPQYMAPEQAQGHHEDIDGRADQFALAVIAYELLTGAPPFWGDSAVAVAYQIVHEDPPPARHARPDLPAAVDAVLTRALAKKPEQRFESVLAFADAFARACGETPHATAFPMPLRRRERRTRAITTTIDARVCAPSTLRVKRRRRFYERPLPLSIGVSLALAAGVAAARLLVR